jgi:hypothetical protein
MGTEYNLYEDTKFGKLTIGEMSNKLEFIYDSPGNSNLDNLIASKEMSPEEMVKIFLKGLTICSYWMDIDDFKTLMRDHMTKEIY